MIHTGFYPGSFDPVTLGHLDVIGRASRLVDRLVIGVGVHPAKAPLFTAAERVAMLEAEVAPVAKACGMKIDVVTFGGLVVAEAKARGASVIVRSLRDGTDFDYEMQMAGMNGTMEPGVQTVFIAANPALRHITGTLVRQIAQMGGDVRPFVPAAVAGRLTGKTVNAGGPGLGLDPDKPD